MKPHIKVSLKVFFFIGWTGLAAIAGGVHTFEDIRQKQIEGDYLGTRSLNCYYLELPRMFWSCNLKNKKLRNFEMTELLNMIDKSGFDSDLKETVSIMRFELSKYNDASEDVPVKDFFR
ncbi:hypothetical protein ACV1C6_21075 [Aeromonas sanarellii]